ncbi:hypothetical protein BC834DRAFT_75273 [Gloeopeniophorella convolvens]|nr:hypothetical protein BC834DRAFT_75273 [Gloeopeniophorella convolvens]
MSRSRSRLAWCDPGLRTGTKVRPKRFSYNIPVIDSTLSECTWIGTSLSMVRPRAARIQFDRIGQKLTNKVSSKSSLGSQALQGRAAGSSQCVVTMFFFSGSHQHRLEKWVNNHHRHPSIIVSLPHRVKPMMIPLCGWLGTRSERDYSKTINMLLMRISCTVTYI